MWSPKSLTLRIDLSVQRLSIAKLGSWWPGQSTAYDSLSTAPGVDAEPWRPALDALAQWLAAHDGKKSTLQVVLSGRFVRWQLLPWRAELTQRSELATYATLRFREIFGKAADDWQILHSPQPPGKTVPACAIDHALMLALSSTCEATGARLAVVTPYFASAFDHRRKALDGKTSWFGLIEADCLTLGLLQGGNWVALRSQRLDDDWREVLPSMMVQMGIVANLADAQVPLYLVGEGAAPTPQPGLAFTWLPSQAGRQA